MTNQKDNDKKYIQDALASPDKIYKSPKDVLNAPDLSTHQKIKILEVWKHDAIELEVADDENMPGKHTKHVLAEILESLRILEEKQ